MNWLAQLHWREPLWLLLMAAPWLMPPLRRPPAPADRLRRFADPPLLQWLLIGAAQRPLRAYALAAAWMLAALAAAGPYWLPENAAQGEQHGADVVVMIDISPSMAAADVAPTRLERVKRELRDLSALLGSDRLGLVAFSANAYPVLPLTTDHEAFLRFVDLLDPSLTERPGSNLARALEVAAGLLRNSAKGSRALVLLSDGEFHDRDGLETARRLVADELPLFVVGVGTAGGAPVPAGDGHFLRYRDQAVVSRLDRAALASIAAAAHGDYFDLRDDDGEWRALLAALRSRTRAAAHASVQPPSAIALYPWLLAASLTLFLWSGLRRREGLALWLLPLLMMAPPSPAEAAPWSEQRAYDALQRGDYEQAQRLYGRLDDYDGQLGLGVAAYRRGDWQAALSAFEHAAARAADDGQRARALYNTGNALAQLHRFEAASRHYREALRLQPDLAKAALNLSLVNQFLDDRNGERPNEDKPRPPAAVAGAGRAAAGEADRRHTGSDRSEGDKHRRSQAASPASQGGTQGTARHGGDEPPQPDRDVRLQQALALWQDRIGHGAAAELDALKDDSAELLRYRFMIDDRGPKAIVIEEKPW